MKESPMFSKLKAEGKTSVNPLKESFRKKSNFKMVLLALFGAVMGQGVVWYTGQFYAQNFLETKCFIEFEQSRTIMLWAIAFATPFFILWGWLSDKIGRKWIMMLGMALAIFTYRPIFSTFLKDSDPVNWNAKYKATLTKADIEKYGKNGLSFFNLTKIDTTHINDTTKITTTRCIFPAGEAVTLIRTDITHSSEAVNKESNTVFSNKHLSKSIYWKFVGLVCRVSLLHTVEKGRGQSFIFLSILFVKYMVPITKHKAATPIGYQSPTNGSDVYVVVNSKPIKGTNPPNTPLPI